jgi:DNA (cytosine-5)-methyltransferase 1
MRAGELMLGPAAARPPAFGPGIDAAELIVDSFAGGGGASTGIERALGRAPDIAINHDAEALALHAANHPSTRHFCRNVWQVDPLEAVRGRPVGLAWFSPDCKHFSKAKGGRPVKRSIRDLAWVVVLWARRVRPRVIVLENVEEFRDWGPVDAEGRPCADRRGQTFRQWVGELRRLGYRVGWQELRACDYGAPTIRKRLFLVARRDGLPIVFPEPTHGPGLIPYRTAAEIIDWSLPCPSIFLTPEEARAIGVKRPLAEATMTRIAKGVKRYVLDAAEPFIVRVDMASAAARNGVHGMEDPLRTLTTGGSFAMVAPTLVQTGYGERPGQSPRVPGLDKPLGTVVAGGAKHALVAAFLAQHNGGMVGHDAREPVSTLTAGGAQQQVVTAGLINLKGTARAMRPADAAVPTLTAGGTHVAEVRAFLIKYYGADQDPRLEAPLHTVTTRDRFGLVTVAGEDYAIADIGMRMLSPRELYRAQGFPDDYVIDAGPNDRPLTKTAQIRMCGNSVCPPVAEAVVRANFAAVAAGEGAAA